jgi:hypothetical protein
MKDLKMAAEIIPAEERGEFRLTDQMLMEAGAASLAAFEILLCEEAYRRGLDLRIDEDMRTGDLIVRWRPGHKPSGLESS